MDFSRARILCIGDVMLDRFHYCDAGRISPEAPVPVLRLQKTMMTLGGAGNVARNVASLGGQAVLIGLVGEDDAARQIRDLAGQTPLLAANLVSSPCRPTICKSRYLATNQQVVRVDEEEVRPLVEDERAAICAAIGSALPDCDAVILSDYSKGAIDDGVTDFILREAQVRSVPVFADSKHRDFSRYRGAACIKPNARELAQVTGMDTDSEAAAVAAARRLLEISGAEAILVTLAERGMMLVERNGTVSSAPARARQVFDVSGAGDTVISAFALASVSGHLPAQAMRIANAAAGVVVGKLGTAAIEMPELLQALEREEREARYRAGGPGKIAALAEAIRLRELWRQRGLSVGFTNGCFDIFHSGHVALLVSARAACDRLIVALNSDASVRRLKGASRPVNSLNDRQIVMEALEPVDLVLSFEEDTPLDLIDALRPDVLIKGGDYTVETVVGANLVHEAGGTVVLVDLVEGQSTTKVLERASRNLVAV